MLLMVSVTEYDDVTSSSGEILTMYMVQVKTSAKATYFVAKRYSEFKSLYESLKDNLPKDYRFPNKSLFSNSAQFTKERRVRGFDLMLKLLIQSESQLPTELAAFLELDSLSAAWASDRTTPTIQEGLRRRKLIENEDLRSVNEVTSSKVNTEQPVSTTTITASTASRSEQRQNGSTNWDFKLEHKINETIKREFLDIFSSSIKISSIAYLLLVGCNLIDVSTSRFSRVLVTMLSIGILVAFIRILILKIQARRATVNAV